MTTAMRQSTLETLGLGSVLEIFRRGRGLGRGPAVGSAPAEDEDFTPTPTGHAECHAAVPMPIEQADEELESLG